MMDRVHFLQVMTVMAHCLADADGDDVCDEFEVPGCQDAAACNFNAAATDSDGSCSYPVLVMTVLVTV